MNITPCYRLDCFNRCYADWGSEQVDTAKEKLGLTMPIDLEICENGQVRVMGTSVITEKGFVASWAEWARNKCGGEVNP